jgi:predicted nucleotidyltransferase
MDWLLTFSKVGKEFDYFGWDARKALQLLRESNLSILDLMRTPVRYISETGYLRASQALVHRYLGRRTVIMHYISMAKKHDRDHFGERMRVTLKKYFYVIIPLLSVLFMEQNHQNSSELPPMDLVDLISSISKILPKDFQEALLELLKRKKSSSSLGEGIRISVMDQWITSQMKQAELYSSSLPLVHLHEIPTDDYSAALYECVMRHSNLITS